MNDSEIQSTSSLADRVAAMTLDEALGMARRFEATAATFYRDLADRLQAEVRPLALELAEEEDRHERLLRELSEDPALELHLRQWIEAPASTPGFCAFVESPLLPESPDEDALLDYAKAREEIAREHYGYLAELAPPGPMRDLLRHLEREEQRHADHLALRWSELFSVL